MYTNEKYVNRMMISLEMLSQCEWSQLFVTDVCDKIKSVTRSIYINNNYRI